jgi:hypothetical protein
MKIKVNQLPGYLPVVKDKTNQTMFSNWAWVEANKLARSSAPYYDGHDDASQRITPEVAEYLDAKLITLIVSLNHIRLGGAQINMLGARGIIYHHISVPDFQAPDVNDLIQASPWMEGRTTLVWCGYGQGRTGTMVTAWEILTGRKDKVTAIRESTAEKNNQEDVLNKLPERQLAIFVCDLCHALREYRRSRTKGISFGLGRTAALFKLRNASDASVNIATALETMLQTGLSVGVENYGRTINEAELLACAGRAVTIGLTLEKIKQFVEWAAGQNANPGYFGRATTMGFDAVQRTGQAGATLRGMLQAAIVRFAARRILANDKLG